MKNILVALIFVVSICSSEKLLSYPDTPGRDTVIDAPWRSMRDYVPVLFFKPESFHPLYNAHYQNIPIDPNSNIAINELDFPTIELSAYSPIDNKNRLIFRDSRKNATDSFACSGISFLSEEGKARNNLQSNDQIKSFWHYVARIPIACLGFGNKRGKPGIHYLKASFGNYTKTLKVVVSRYQLPLLGPLDQQYDVHVHTIAEQTKWHGLTNGDSSRLKFGGPLAMLLESAYALGMTDVQLKNGNWSDFKNRIITTDHNVFFSGNPYDAGNNPGSGPTSNSNTNNEFAWYREHFGDLGAEEVTVQGAKGHSRGSLGYNKLKGVDRQGSHLLSYGAPHIEGPWHGGRFNTAYTYMGTDNNITISKAIKNIGSTNGFGYASHPESGTIRWSMDYYARAIGLIYFDRDKNKTTDFRDGSINSSILVKGGQDFAFKGLQIWNERKDKISKKNAMGKKFTTSEGLKIQPFNPKKQDHYFIYKPGWDKENIRVEGVYKKLMARGLNYNFKQNKQRKFIRKLYMSAGTDAHGDFNYSVEGAPRAEVVARDANWNPVDIWDTITDTLSFLADVADLSLDNNNFTDYHHMSASDNAFGRLRTYALTSQRFIEIGSKKDCQKNFPFCSGKIPTVGRQSVFAYNEGNTVVNDGPVGTFSLDSNCRFDSESLIYHDSLCIWENYDGLIGGRGRFDSGNTMLALKTNSGVSMRYHWMGENYFLPDPARPENRSNNMQLTLEQVFGENKFDISKVQFAAKGRFFDHDELLTPLFNRNNGFVSKDKNKYAVDYYQNSAFILSGKLRTGSENETRFITNPIWSSHTTIDVESPRGCPIKPGQLKVTAKFSLSMNSTIPSNNSGLKMPLANLQISMKASSFIKINTTINKKIVTAKQTKFLAAPGQTMANPKTPYTGIKVLIKPLDSNGRSGGKEFNISSTLSKWESNLHFNEDDDVNNREEIADAKYTTSNRVLIPCGGVWDTKIHKRGKDRTSYVVVVTNIRDMHNNRLNSIAASFTAYHKATIKDKFESKFKSKQTQKIKL